MIAYGLEPGKSYSAETVFELLEAARQEGGEAIADAFNQGYKAAALFYSPGSAYWEAAAAAWAKEAKAKAGGPSWGTVAAVGGAGIVIGIAASGILAIVFLGN